MMQQLLEITIVSNFIKTPKACENTLGSSLASNDYAIKTLNGGQYDLKFILIIVYIIIMKHYTSILHSN